MVDTLLESQLFGHVRGAFTGATDTRPGLTRRAQAVLLQHAWPGNVRELENVISSAGITATGDFIDLADLPEHLRHRGPRAAQGDAWRPLSLDEVRKVHIQKGVGHVPG
jgi:transcriptional regulator with PAS, ATPase and Fis domain